MRRLLAAALGSLALLWGNAAFAQNWCPCTHFGMSAEPPRFAIPRKVVLLPVDVLVFRVGPGGAERADDLVKDAKAYIEAELRDGIGKDKKVEFVALPTLDPKAQAQVEEHVALFEQVAAAALRNAPSSSAAWPTKVARFDYGIGPGLRFLKQLTGADAVMFVQGRSTVPTGASYALGAITLLAGVVTVPQGRATAVVGVVDLETGDIIWLNQTTGQNSLADSTRVAFKLYPDSPSGKK